MHNFLDEKHGTKVNFSSSHNTYYSAYKYTTQEDTDFVLSDGHPDMANSSPPKKERAISEKKVKEKHIKKVQEAAGREESVALQFTMLLN